MRDSKPLTENLVLMSFACFFAGIVTDFIFGGVFKIVWAFIQLPAYLCLAITIETYFAHSKVKHLSRYVAIAFAGGALLGHFSFSGHQSRYDYSMELVSDNPLVLKTPAIPELLYVMSDKLTHTLAEEHLRSNIQVTAKGVSDYGCMKRFTIESVDHVGIQSDPGATWTLRLSRLGVFQDRNMPSMDDKEWPWCKIGVPSKEDRPAVSL